MGIIDRSNKATGNESDKDTGKCRGVKSPHKSDTLQGSHKCPRSVPEGLQQQSHPTLAVLYIMNSHEVWPEPPKQSPPNTMFILSFHLLLI